MFGVFVNGLFFSFWMNDETDKNWIERTIQSMGWDKNSIDVYRYEVTLTPTTNYQFNENKNIEILETRIIGTEYLIDGQWTQVTIGDLLDENGQPVLDENGDVYQVPMVDGVIVDISDSESRSVTEDYIVETHQPEAVYLQGMHQ